MHSASDRVIFVCFWIRRGELEQHQYTHVHMYVERDGLRDLVKYKARDMGLIG